MSNTVTAVFDSNFCNLAQNTQQISLKKKQNAFINLQTV